MKKRKRSWRLVVDASIARSAGGKSNPRDPTSSQCREILDAILTICHHLVLTEKIRDEWREHSSRYSKTWLTSMYAHRKVEWVPASSLSSDLASAILDTAVSEGKEQAIAKDLPLIAAALATDRIVLSRDDTMRQLLCNAAAQVKPLQDIAWANPCASRDVLKWLQESRSPHPSRFRILPTP